MPNTLKQRIESRDAKIAVVGLGYVGLPLAVALADAETDVGVDIDRDRVAAVNAGTWPLDPDEPDVPVVLAAVTRRGKLAASVDYAACDDADVIVVTVPTPVADDKQPDYTALRGVLVGIYQHLRPDVLVIVESTLAPGTMEHLVVSRLRSRLIAHCPERVMPGVLWHNLHHVPRVVGGATPYAAELAATLYRSICDSELSLVDATTAEVVKVAENAYRDVQIAFANELAGLCEQHGVDVWRIRELINFNSSRNVHRPGPGVGGACIPKDSWLLLAGGGDRGLIRAAREVNEAMPVHVVRMLREAIWNGPLDCPRFFDMNVALLGRTYRAGTTDERGSPALAVAQILQPDIEIRYHDPRLPDWNGPLVDVLRGADAAVIMVAHDEYRNLDWDKLGNVMRQRILIDTRGVVWPPPGSFTFRALGRGQQL